MSRSNNYNANFTTLGNMSSGQWRNEVSKYCVLFVKWPCGLMDKALVFGTKDCRFESCQGHLACARLKQAPGFKRPPKTL